MRQDNLSQVRQICQGGQLGIANRQVAFDARQLFAAGFLNE
jgi:hypothetical protein